MKQLVYGRTSGERNDWRAAPLLANLAGLTAAQLIVGRLDPLLDDSQRLAARLKEVKRPCLASSRSMTALITISSGTAD